MKRTQIIEKAKQLVLAHGPAKILEFGDEIMRGHTYGLTDADRDAVLVEAAKQSRRVYAFLGYDPVW